MTVCLNNPVLGREITDNFTFNETTKQIVPKPGTDTKPGALALNLGNNLPGDTTNATDALTAAGFNAMANAVDSTAPLCGNEIQQAVAVAVGQSIACDAAAQEAIACAIASNPDAVACLKAVLGGSTTSGKYYVATHTQQDYDNNTVNVGNCYIVDNGVVTNLTPAGLTNQWTLGDVNRDKPIAYYYNSSNQFEKIINQVVMSDTGVTQVPYNFSAGGGGVLSALYHDTVTNCLYMKAGAFGGTALKFTLNSSGLITGESEYTDFDYIAHGVELFNGSTQARNLSTGVVSTVGTFWGQNFKPLDISPDGTKWAHSDIEAGFGGVVRIRSTTSNTVIATINGGGIPFDSYLYGYGFFTQDSQSFVVAGARWNSNPDLKFGQGHRVFSATTGQLLPNKIGMYSTFSSGGGMSVASTQHYASNNSILTLAKPNPASFGEVRIHEYKNDIWQEVARLPGVYAKAGFYLVSA